MNSPIDLSHLVFIDLIRNIVQTAGVKVAKGNLIRIALNTGSKAEKKDFPTFADFVRALNADDNPLSRLEGKAIHLGAGIFGLRLCPFSHIAKTYKNYFATGLNGFDQLIAEYNAPSKITDEYKIGRGAGVGPFCVFHQPMRSQAGSNLTIAGQPIEIYQLACRHADGEVGYADALIAEFGCGRAAVEQIMEEYHCCYGIRMKDGSPAC